MTDIKSLAPSGRDLPLEVGGEVSILLTANGLRLRGVDGDRVAVRTRGGADIDDEIVMESSPGRVVIREAERGFRLGPIRMRTSGAADLEIDVPRFARVSLRTLSGDVDAIGLAGESRWASASGDIHLRIDGGSLSVESMSGDVTLEATAAIGIRARSVSGDVRIRAPRIDALGASTTSGDIRVEGELGKAVEHTISSVSGDVELVTPSPVRVETQTIAGDVRASGTHSAEGGRGRRTLVAGAGSVRVGIRTTSGDIRLRAEGAAGAAPAVTPPHAVPTAPVPPVPPVAPASAAPPVPTAAPVPPAAPVIDELSESPTVAVAVEPPVVVAEAEAAPNLVRPIPADAGDGETIEALDAEATVPSSAAARWGGVESSTDRREAARLEILRALERGDLDVEAASHRLEQLEEAGPRSFRGWC